METTDGYEKMRKDFRTALSSGAHIAFNNEHSWTGAQIIDLSFGGVRICLLEKNAPSTVETGTPVSVKVSIHEKEETFPGHIVWISSETDEDIKRNTTKMGIQFDGLSLDHKADLVSLFMWNKFQKSEKGS